MPGPYGNHRVSRQPVSEDGEHGGGISIENLPGHHLTDDQAIDLFEGLRSALEDVAEVNDSHETIERKAKEAARGRR